MDTCSTRTSIMKKIAAFFLAIALGLMFVPALASADEAPGQDFPKKFFSVDEIDDLTYSTKTIIPKLTVTDDDTGAVLATTDYSVSYQMDSGGTWVDVTEIINAGVYKVTVTGKNDYEGETIERPFTVIGAPVTITAKDAEKDYDGYSLRQPEFEVEGMPEGDMHIFTVEMTKDSVLTYADDIDNVIATVDGVDVIPHEQTAVGNYLVTARNGELRVNKVRLKVAAYQQNYTYNASLQGPAGTYTDDFDKYVEVRGLVGGDFLTSLTMTGSAVEAGQFLSLIKPTAVEITGGKATGSYDITFVPADMIIEPATVTAEWEKNADSKSAVPATGDDAGMLAIPIAIVAGISLVVLIGSAVRRRAA